jgi:hypothetical protein
MGDKYYIPYTNEFYPGVEYILRKKSSIDDKNRYIIRTIKESDLDDIIWIKRTLSRDNGFDEILMKYLDKEDIQSLGFVIKFEGYPMIYIRDVYLLTHYDKYEIEDYKLDGLIIICKNNNKIFEGRIKNKSELKVLFRQLGL